MACKEAFDICLVAGLSDRQSFLFYFAWHANPFTAEPVVLEKGLYRQM